MRRELCQTSRLFPTVLGFGAIPDTMCYLFRTTGRHGDAIGSLVIVRFTAIGNPWKILYPAAMILPWRRHGKNHGMPPAFMGRCENSMSHYGIGIGVVVMGCLGIALGFMTPIPMRSKVR